MFRRRTNASVATVALLAGALLTVGGQQAQADTTRGVQTVTLPTGQHVVVVTTPDGGQQALAQPGEESLRILTIGHDVYAVPDYLASRVGNGLDLSAFDVSRIAAGQTGFEVATTVPVPGATGGRVTDPTAFGAALHSKSTRDAVTRLSRTGAAPATPPAGKTGTLRIVVTGADGKPAENGTVFLSNTEDYSKFTTFLGVEAGEVRVDVPAGNYFAVVAQLSADTGVRYVLPLTDFAVAGDTVTTVDADLRAATAPARVRGPRPAERRTLNVSFGRVDKLGQLVGVLVSEADKDALFAPAGRATVGGFDFGVFAQLATPDLSATYDLAFHDDHVPATIDYTANQKTLAVLHTRYFGDTPHTGNRSRSGQIVGKNGGGGLLTSYPVAMPSRTVEYVTGGPDVAWTDLVTGNQEDPPAQGMTSTAEIYPAGADVERTWLAGVLAPGIPYDAEYRGVNCLACRAGDHFRLDFPDTDATPGHKWYPGEYAGDQTVTNAALAASGKKLATADGPELEATATTPDPTTYTLTVDQAHNEPWVTASKTSHTEWTFRSAAPEHGTIPRNGCRGELNCVALPLITLNYQLDTAMDHTRPAGPTELTLTVGHQRHSTDAAIVDTSVQFSVDGGTSWLLTTMTPLGAGKYRVNWARPDSQRGKPVALRTTATDTEGNAIIQTVTAAYLVAN